MKKSLIVLLSMAALSVSLAGCGNGTNASSSSKIQPSADFNASGFPIVKKPITLNIFAVQSPLDGPYNQMQMFNQYQKMTNVNVNWQDVPSDGAAEKENLVLASGNLPDVFYKAGITPLDVVKYGNNGTFIPLEGLIKKYAPNIQKLFDEHPDVKEALTAPDGHIYALSDIVTLQAARTNKIWLNQTMLQGVGMSVPTTTDQLEQVLKAFKQKYPDDIPLAARNFADLVNGLGGAWGLQDQMGYNINITNNQVHLWLADDQYKQFLMYLHQLYQENLLDHQLFTQTTAKYTAKMQSGNVGIFFNQATDAFPKVAKEYTGVAPFKGPNGDQMYRAAPITRSIGAFAITSADKNPAATIRWIDYFYGDEGSIFFRYGIKGTTFNYDSSGLPQYTASVMNDPRGYSTAIGAFTPWPGGGSPEWINDKNSSAIDPPQVQAAESALDPYLPKTTYAAPLFDANTSTTLSDLTNQINTFVDQESAKFITGQLSFSSWDQYVSTLNKMGLDQVQKIYQTAFNQTYAK